MSEDANNFSEEDWDEYQWEKFLQEQDRNTEKYFGLLEKYVDHPDRDEVIACEMGWDFSPDDRELEEFPGFVCEEEIMDITEHRGGFEEFSRSPIYKDTLRLHRWIHNWIESDKHLSGHPEAIRFAARSAVCGAKLAAALCGNDSTEIGMTIAYLKRALKAANDALDAAARLADAGLLDKRRAATARRHVFTIRNRVVDFMNEYRREWRKRCGDSGF